MDFKKVFNTVGKFVKKNSPAILTGVGITGMATAGVLAALNASKFKDAYDELPDDKDKKEVSKLCLRHFGIPLAIAASGAGCIIFSDKIMAGRQAALATAYLGAEKALTTYQEKVVEKLGEKEAKEIKQEIVQDEIKKDPIPTDLIDNGDGKQLFKDLYSGQFFRSTAAEIRKAEGTLKARLQSEEFIEINDLWWLIDSKLVTDAGKGIGWNVNLHSADDDLLEIVPAKGPDGENYISGIKLLDVGPRRDYFGY